MIKLRHTLAWEERELFIQYLGETFEVLSEIEEDIMDILKNFIESEINTKALYDEIIHFINSYEVRKGEFEGNEFIILKIDRDNFILYPEYTDQDGSLSIPYSLSIYKQDLLNSIELAVKQKELL